MAHVHPPWPGTPGGAYSPAWGEDIRLYVWAAVYAGRPMRWGPVADGSARLTAGNVWGSGAAPVTPAPPGNRLWIDLSCDTLDVETHVGGTRSDGALTRAEAATCRITLADPTRKYDPLNPDSPYVFQGRSRLMPGTPFVVFAETLGTGDSGPVQRHNLFTGTVDEWTEPWEPHPIRRRATVVASDAVKTLVGLDRGEQPPAGAGDTVDQRIERVLTFYGSAVPRRLDPSGVTLQPTTFGSSAWDLIGRATDDEIGFAYVDRDGTLQFHNRATWSTTPPPVIAVGCSPTVTDEADIVIDATVTTTDALLRNAVYASREEPATSPTGAAGTTQSARSESSIAMFGEHGFKATGLGHDSDVQVAQWAMFVLTLQGWPRARVETVIIRPALDPARWPAVLDLDLIVDRVRVLWTPPDATTTYDTTGRVLGVDHRITHAAWETGWQLAHADIFARVFRWGPVGDGTDVLNAGNVYAPTGG